MKSHRLARVAEVVREVAAETILFELKDPRVKGVTVTRAEVSADLQHAKVFVSVMGSEKDQKLTLHGLKSAAGYIQTKVADRLTSRYVPHVSFVVDEGVKKSIEIARLLEQEKAQLAADAAARGEPPPEAATTASVADQAEDEDDSPDAAEGAGPDTPEPGPAAGPPPAAQPRAADGPAGHPG